MGRARMGNDPCKSAIEQWNRVLDLKNLLVTDLAASIQR